MAEVNFTQSGVVFLNSLGQYAYTGRSSGFSQREEVIHWTDNINHAAIFSSAENAKLKHKGLKGCQYLFATATREVMLKEPEGN